MHNLNSCIQCRKEKTFKGDLAREIYQPAASFFAAAPSFRYLDLLLDTRHSWVLSSSHYSGWPSIGCYRPRLVCKLGCWSRVCVKLEPFLRCRPDLLKSGVWVGGCWRHLHQGCYQYPGWWSPIRNVPKVWQSIMIDAITLDGETCLRAAIHHRWWTFRKR